VFDGAGDGFSVQLSTTAFMLLRYPTRG